MDHSFRTPFPLISLLLITLFLSGCAGFGDGRSIDDPTSSLVFGFIDMEDAPTDISYAKLQQVAPRGEAGFWGMSADDGIVYNQYLPMGTFQMERFGGSSFLWGEHVYTFPTYGRNETALKIEQPGIYFVGAYAYRDEETGFFEPGQFSIETLDDPTEISILKQIQSMDWVRGTQWEERIRLRLAELQ